jgi:UDP-2-acetamido-2-deoxy-ribo-hexuluronate aminotransferase
VVAAKLAHFPAEVEARARIGARYSERLRRLCAAPEVMPGNTHVYAQYTVRIPERDRVAEALKAAGIPTAVYYPKCLHEQPAFAGLGHRLGDFPESEHAAREVLSLPMHALLGEADQDRVIAEFERALQPARSAR